MISWDLQYANDYYPDPDTWIAMIQREEMQKTLKKNVDKASEQSEKDLKNKTEEWQKVKAHLESEVSNLLTDLEQTKQAKNDEAKYIPRTPFSDILHLKSHVCILGAIAF